MSTPKSITRSPLTSAPALAGTFIVLTLLVAGPLVPVDKALQGYWAKRYTPNWADFLDAAPNALAGQAVCLPILLAVALWLARKHRTWHPLAIVVAAEVGFYGGIGTLKFVLARSYPTAGNGHFWAGGMIEHGAHGISYPSGHAAEAILIYGAAAYLLRTYAEPDWRIHRRLNWIVALVTANALVVSFYLGFHWPSDLLAGVIAGALVLRLIVDGDRAIATRRTYYGIRLDKIVPSILHLPPAQAARVPRPAGEAPAAVVRTSSSPARPAKGAAPGRPAPPRRPPRPSIRIGEPHTWVAPSAPRPGRIDPRDEGDRDRIAS
ncbi:phosphatase PAP2 family protein [Janibacter corallicola]|uniref:phosphatase PAP2 family protein n=1 Tax=Janibacter corallicola TaxID=415212 RepID=UPI00082A65FF|nr:phosphatase PAP2 family protein [Janibacter corallicola]